MAATFLTSDAQHIELADQALKMIAPSRGIGRST
jgi:hypothetical protein